MCTACGLPYCGGRVNCVQESEPELQVQQLLCQECEWHTLGCSDDRRCMVHGHRYAMFKCDSCCAIATWNCKRHHYCDRCHPQASAAKHYPCPGAGLCPLGIPHPRNVEAVLSHSDFEQYPAFRSFVLGCTACLGCDTVFQEVQSSWFVVVDEWGYPARNWEDFDSGSALLAAAGEKEVRDRLAAVLPPLPPGGSPVECAERLLLHQRKDAQDPDALLLAVGAAKIRQRLGAVGLSQGGSDLAQAVRLLSLLRAEAWEVREQDEEEGAAGCAQSGAA